jgi:hypothetical protein
MGAVQLKHAASGKCLDVLGGTGNPTGTVGWFACGSPATFTNQQWRAQVPASLVLLLLLLLA